MNYPTLILVIGGLLIAGYFVYQATNEQGTAGCTGTWFDAINPLCYLSQAAASGESELNTLVIILAVVAIVIVGLLAFGPQTGHIAHTAGAIALV